jgi:hypothetical protein
LLCPQLPFAQGAAARPPAGPSNHGAAAAVPAAAAAVPPANLFPYAKLRFSWDPNAAPGMTPQPAVAPGGGGGGVAAMAMTPGLAVSGISGLIAPVGADGAAAAGGAMPMLGDITPISRPFAGSFGGFGSAFADTQARGAAATAAAAAIAAASSGSGADGAGLAVDGTDFATDDALAAAVPQPVKCASPDAPADPFAFAPPGGAAGDVAAGSAFSAAAGAIGASGDGAAAGQDGGVMLFGGGGNVRTVGAPGGAGGPAGASTVMMDSFDALRLSSMSNWPMKLRGQFGVCGEGEGGALAGQE